VARRQMEDFLDAVQSGGAPMAGGHDGLSVIRVIENCYEVKSKRSRPDHLPLPGLVW
jgi:predicted dehydrogenase